MNIFNSPKMDYLFNKFGWIYEDVLVRAYKQVECNFLRSTCPKLKKESSTLSRTSDLANV